MGETGDSCTIRSRWKGENELSGLTEWLYLVEWVWVRIIFKCCDPRFRGGAMSRRFPLGLRAAAIRRALASALDRVAEHTRTLTRVNANGKKVTKTVVVAAHKRGK